MRHSLPRCRLLSSVAALIAVLALPACTVEAGDEAAYAIAEKFAAESDLPQPEQHDLAVSQAQSAASANSEPAVGEDKPAEEKRLTAERAWTDQVAEAKRPSTEERNGHRPVEAERLAAAKAATERPLREELEAEEAEMLARAQAEAAERKQGELKRLREIEAKAAEEERRRLAEEKRRSDEIVAREAARRAEEQRIAEIKAAEAKRLAEIAAQEEARRVLVRRMALERQRAEEERRKAAEERRLADEHRRAAEERHRAAEEKRVAEIESENRSRAAAEARRIAAERQLEEEGRRRAEQTRALAALKAPEEQPILAPSYQEIERAREAEQLAEKLKLIRFHRAERTGSLPRPYGLGAQWPIDPYEAAALPVFRTQVTVLLVMQPGNRGIRRFDKTADPILCMSSRCYVSRGAGSPAEAISRRKAFGPGIALGSRAGLCNNSLTCVFRNVDLERTMAEIQPIDLRILRHDRREPRTIMADPTCKLENERLTCRRPVIASDYMMWVVPENVAEQAGSLLLETAVRAGLSSYPSVASTGRN